MAKKLDGDEGRAKYKLRKRTVEPVLGTVKSMRGFWRFSLLGVYGVMASYVLRRVPEIGIRLALGATTRDVRSLVLKRAGLFADAGIVAGTCIAIPLSSVVQRLLYGAKLADGWLLSGAALLFLALSFLASYLPVRRATSVNPVLSLRLELRRRRSPFAQRRRNHRLLVTDFRDRPLPGLDVVGVEQVLVAQVESAVRDDRKRPGWVVAAAKLKA